MNIPPSEAQLLSLHDYEMILWNWNDNHRSPDDVDPPDPEDTMRLIDRINADPRLTGPRPAQEPVN